MIPDFIASLPYGDLVWAAIIIIASVIAARIFIFILVRGVLHVTSKTKNTLDDAIVDAIRKPVYIAIILAGILFALLPLHYVAAYVDQIQLAFTVIWILLGAYTATRIMKVVFQWYIQTVGTKTKSKMDETIAPILRKILSAFIYAIALMIILKTFGFEITPMVAGLGIGGLAIALALQDTLANLISGTFMVSDKAIKAGDFIEIEGGMKGFVEEIGWRSTRIRTLPNNYVIVPNSKIANSIITDYSDPVEEMSVVIQVGVAYWEDLEKVEKVTVDVAKHIQQTVEGALRDFQPFIRYHTFADSNINFSVILRVNKFVDQYLVTHEFVKALKKRYDDEGIDISFPVRTIINKKD